MKLRVGLILATTVAGVVVGTCGLVNRAHADAPLLDDGTFRIDSKNRRFFAVRSPDEKSTIVFRKAGRKPPVRLWEMPEWPAVAFLSDDGDYLVTGYFGVNLLELNHKPDEVMVSFYKRGTLVKRIHLDELILDSRHLRRTNSHYFWGFCDGFVGAHRFAVDTVEQRRIVFDVTTGAVAEVVVPSPSVMVRP